jgi:sorbitol-specific phosphotransferase system component IIBC
MNFGVRVILLLAAVVSFIICIFATEHFSDWLAIGLACLAGSFVVGDLGWDRPLGAPTRRTD